MQVLSTEVGVAVLAVFSLFCILLTSLAVRGKVVSTKESYLVANRRVGWVVAALSIAATWVWAPSLFVAAQQGYQHGWVGVFWFTVPNVLCLIGFGFFAAKVRRDHPDGFTLSAIMRDRYSTRVSRVYQAALIGLAVCSFAVQLLAGGLILSTLTGMSFTAMTISMAAIAVAYSLHGGMNSSVVMGYTKMILIVVVGLTVVPWVVTQAGVDTLTSGLSGVTRDYTSLTSGAGAALFWSFGLSTTIGLLSGPFGDQSFWQRAFSTREGEVRKSFILGGLIFAIVPLTMATLGFLASGAQIPVADVQLVNITAILHWLPEWTAVPFVILVLSGLTSTIDSNLSAVSMFAGHDYERVGHSPVRNARLSMIILATIATALANTPGLTVVALFIIYGTLRSSTLIPTVLTILNRRVGEKGVFYGITAALVIGVPISAYGNLTGNVPAIVGASLFVLASSGAVALTVGKPKVNVAAEVAKEAA